ncbi:unnamed protein product [Penicillium salamii]|uniref:Homeobox domain-containing protein n=1 Tax=Penicillium salamii TaxID=1612424 RepID=A0A9W4JKX9_9EURO|nr:unnamed protein product [Penicillium salamii]CAG8046094.1 unnamed protein product [Penicillium salamii]CAG8123849.1 unnamed protein product [Penicillium salamii]CAG8197781.1 unnamed protein product [Penicillium salamii]CAG8304460.1 unnamed protein product [Penicillium salamii]
MSQSRQLDDDTDMAISYTQPSVGHQTLPSFRELLPAHLHDEIESTSPYYTSPRSQDRPGSGHEMADPRSIPYGTPSKVPYDAHREYTVSRGERMDPGHAMRFSEGASRGPSPILPPIRDLDTMSGRPVNHKGYERAPRSDPFVTQEYRQPGPAPMAAMPDRRSAEQYAPIMHPQSPYGHPTMGYDEQVSPQMIAHGQQANFGIMGDPIDPKTKRRRGNLPKPVTDILRAWFHEHLDHPYPSEEDKQMFMTRTGLSISQISNWFINARRRQLPALRNQMRSGPDADSQRQSPFSDMDSELPSPHH